MNATTAADTTWQTDVQTVSAFIIFIVPVIAACAGAVVAYLKRDALLNNADKATAKAELGNKVSQTFHATVNIGQEIAKIAKKIEDVTITPNNSNPVGVSTESLAAHPV